MSHFVAERVKLERVVRQKKEQENADSEPREPNKQKRDRRRDPGSLTPSPSEVWKERQAEEE